MSATPTFRPPAGDIAAIAREAARRLADALHAEQIYLFGSHVWGIPNESSDLDFYVIVPSSDEPPHRRAQAAHRALAGLGLPCDVLVHTRTEVERARQVRTSLARRVLAEGRLLHG